MISVIIPVHNRKDYVINAVKSVLKDKEKDVEIIVTKNYIDDNIDRELDRYGVINVYEKHDWIGKKIKTALLHSHGDTILFLEDDDQFITGKISNVIKSKKEKKWNYYHNGRIITDENGNEIRTEIEFDPFVAKPKYTMDDLMNIHRKKVYYNSSSMAVDFSILENNKNKMENLKLVLDIFIFFSSLLEDAVIYESGRNLTSYMKHNSASGFYTYDYEVFLEKASSFFKTTLEDASLFHDDFNNHYLEKYYMSWLTFLQKSYDLFSFNTSRSKYYRDIIKFVPFGRRLNFLTDALLKSPPAIKNIILKRMFIGEYKIERRN
ncbi:glycosyltransferase family 2 protein [Caldiplasma sukawensis]